MSKISSKKTPNGNATQRTETRPWRNTPWFHSVLKLQREVGNQAVLSVLSDRIKQPATTLSTASESSDLDSAPVANASDASRLERHTGCDCGGRCPKCQAAQGPNNPTRSAGKSPLHDVGTSESLPSDISNEARERFGYDFSHVRIHSGDSANESAAKFRAKAYSFGSHIVFGKGHYVPTEEKGRKLIAHELAHVVQQAPAHRAEPRQSGNSTAEQDANNASEAFIHGGQVSITAQSRPSIARMPDDTSDEEYLRDLREEKAKGRDKPKRGAAPRETAPQKSPTKVANEAATKIQKMIDDAKAGRFRYSSIKSKTQLTQEFRKLLDNYRINELGSIDYRLSQPDLSADARTALINRKRSIVADRTFQQYTFDEALRTPRGTDVSVQKPMVRGAEAHSYHETTPGKGSYAQPDYSITCEPGRTRINVNLKSHDLRFATAADARAIAKDATAQAVKNAYGNPLRKGDVGHLPEGENIVISFVDKPNAEAEAAMLEVMFDEGSPISQVRFGERTIPRTGTIGQGRVANPLQFLEQQAATEPLAQGAERSPAPKLPSEAVAKPVEPGVKPIEAPGETVLPPVEKPGGIPPGVKGTAVPLLTVGVQVAGAYFHQQAQEKRTEKARESSEKGYVPPSSVTGGTLDKIGDVLYDPDRSGAKSVSLKSRLDMPKWRNWARSYFSGHKPGDLVKFTWYGGDDDYVVYYLLEPNGKWSLALPEYMKVQFSKIILDINDVLSTSVPDQQLWDFLIPWEGIPGCPECA